MWLLEGTDTHFPQRSKWLCVASRRESVHIPFLFNTYLKMAMLFLGSEPQEAEELDPARGLRVAHSVLEHRLEAKACA